MGQLDRQSVAWHTICSFVLLNVMAHDGDGQPCIAGSYCCLLSQAYNAERIQLPSQVCLLPQQACVHFLDPPSPLHTPHLTASPRSAGGMHLGQMA